MIQVNYDVFFQMGGDYPPNMSCLEMHAELCFFL